VADVIASLSLAMSPMPQAVALDSAHQACAELETAPDSQDALTRSRSSMPPLRS